MTCWCGGGIAFNSAGAEVCAESEFHDPLADGRPVKVDRLYVAGPMSGYPENNYPEFHHAADQLRDGGYLVANPAERETEFAKPAPYVDLLRDDLIQMFKCQGVAVLDNWWESTGARNEVMVAGLLRMPCRTVAEWLTRAGKDV